MPRKFLIAIQFMTVFRLRQDLAETTEDLAASVAWYPLVGLVLGGLLAALSELLVMLFPSGMIIGLLLCLGLALLTHGLHLDGLADTADAMFSHRDRARKLEIMKDSAVGVFGAVSLVMVIGLKAAALGYLAGRPGAWAVFCLFPVWGRLAVSMTACLSVYARPQGGLGKPFIDLAGSRELLVAGLSAAVLSVLLLGLPGLVAALVIGLAATAGVRFWRGQLGGVTGDILGATAELGELLGLLMATALFYSGLY